MSVDKGNWYFQKTRGEMVEFLPKDYSTVLEIGCGEGNFASHLRAGSEIWGIEPSSSSSVIASGKMHRVLVGKWEEVADELADNYFDLVICNDVIEHMPNHDEFFLSIRDKIKSQGYLIGSVPNVRYYKHLYELLIQKDWRYRDYGILDNTHLRFFSEKSLRRTLINHGFIIEELTGINLPNYYQNKNFSIQNFVKTISLKAVEALTLGFYSDISFLQLGFRVRKEN